MRPLLLIYATTTTLGGTVIVPEELSFTTLLDIYF